MRMGPAFFSILGGFVRFSHDILGFVGGEGGSRKKIISGIDRAH